MFSKAFHGKVDCVSPSRDLVTITVHWLVTLAQANLVRICGRVVAREIKPAKRTHSDLRISE